MGFYSRDYYYALGMYHPAEALTTLIALGTPPSAMVCVLGLRGRHFAGVVPGSGI